MTGYLLPKDTRGVVEAVRPLVVQGSGGTVNKDIDSKPRALRKVSPKLIVTRFTITTHHG